MVLWGCAPLEFSYRQLVMGVEAKVTVVAPDEATALDAARAAFARLNELEQVMSDYRDDSEVMRLSRTHDEAVSVSDDLLLVLGTAQDIRVRTDGAFDVTLGPLTLLWREARRSGDVPDQASIDAARARCGGDSVLVDPAGHTVTLRKPEMRLDLGGIGKGFAAEQAIETLRTHDCPSALVAIAGDIAAGDAPPGSRGWTVATADGDSLLLANASVSTSGDAEQFINIGGVRYSHVLDHTMGMGSTLHLEATVIGPSGAVVDALASALVVLQPDEGLAIMRSFCGYEARIVEHGAEGVVRERTTAGWPHHATRSNSADLRLAGYRDRRDGT